MGTNNFDFNLFNNVESVENTATKIEKGQTKFVKSYEGLFKYVNKLGKDTALLSIEASLFPGGFCVWQLTVFADNHKCQLQAFVNQNYGVSELMSFDNIIVYKTPTDTSEETRIIEKNNLEEIYFNFPEWKNFEEYYFDENVGINIWSCNPGGKRYEPTKCGDANNIVQFYCEVIQELRNMGYSTIKLHIEGDFLDIANDLEHASWGTQCIDVIPKYTEKYFKKSLSNEENEDLYLEHVKPIYAVYNLYLASKICERVHIDTIYYDNDITDADTGKSILDTSMFKKLDNPLKLSLNKKDKFVLWRPEFIGTFDPELLAKCLFPVDIASNSALYDSVSDYVFANNIAEFVGFSVTFGDTEKHYYNNGYAKLNDTINCNVAVGDLVVYSDDDKALIEMSKKFNKSVLTVQDLASKQSMHCWRYLERYKNVLGDKKFILFEPMEVTEDLAQKLRYMNVKLKLKIDYPRVENKEGQDIYSVRCLDKFFDGCDCPDVYKKVFNKINANVRAEIMSNLDKEYFSKMVKIKKWRQELCSIPWDKPYGTMVNVWSVLKNADKYYPCVGSVSDVLHNFSMFKRFLPTVQDSIDYCEEAKHNWDTVILDAVFLRSTMLKSANAAMLQVAKDYIVQREVTWLHMLKPCYNGTFRFAIRLDDYFSPDIGTPKYVLNIKEISEACDTEGTIRCLFSFNEKEGYVCKLDDYAFLPFIALKRALKNGVLVNSIAATLKAYYAKNPCIVEVTTPISDDAKPIKMKLSYITNMQRGYAVFDGDISSLLEPLNIPKNVPLFYCLEKINKGDKVFYKLIDGNKNTGVVPHDNLRLSIKSGKVYVLNMHIADNGHLILEDF